MWHAWPEWRRNTSPVGNDVVDLRHPHCQPEAIHPGFDSRVFAASEVEQLKGSTHVHRTRWSLWAAKESVFKVCRKLDSQVRFLPRNFTVRLFGEWAEVVHHSGRFEVWLDHNENWVHAMTSQKAEKPTFQVEGDSTAPPEMADRDSSGRARELARCALGNLLKLPPAEVEIIARHRIPLAHRRGKPLPFDLSLSHDGRFVSCAWETA